MLEVLKRYFKKRAEKRAADAKERDKLMSESDLDSVVNVKYVLTGPWYFACWVDGCESIFYPER